MNVEHDHAALRRYVLGRSSDDERDRIEREYFDDPEALEWVCAAEDDLIDDYLSNSLIDEERDLFEEYYLAVPQHRTRVGVARALRTAARPSNDRIEPTWWTTTLWGVRGWPRFARVAVVAALVLLVAAVVLLLRARSQPDAVIVTTAPPSPPTATSASTPNDRERRDPKAPGLDKEAATPPALAPIVALSISPINVRGAGDPATLSIPAGSRAVRLLLQGEAAELPLARGRVIVRTVPGREVWRGPTARSTPASALARVDVPVERLPPDDYIVELLAPDASGRPLSDVERYRYFLRVRHGPGNNDKNDENQR
jgi:hypothetical protein